MGTPAVVRPTWPPASLVRDAWRACSTPSSFFRELARDHEPRPLRAACAASIAVVLALGVLSLAFVRATLSDGIVLVWLAAIALGLPAFSLLLLLGGLVMVRPTALDARAWEVAGWAWAPAGALALSLLPAVVVAPSVSAAVGIAAFPVWHLVVLVHALRVLAPRRHLVATLWYLAAVGVAPAMMALVGYATVRGGG